MEVVPRCRAGRCEAAGGDRRHLAGRVNTAVPGQRRHPPRSGLAHAERGNPARVQTCWFGGLTVRNAELSGGNRMVQEANAGGRKATGNRILNYCSPLSGETRTTGRIPRNARTREGADVDQVSLWRDDDGDDRTRG